MQRFRRLLGAQLSQKLARFRPLRPATCQFVTIVPALAALSVAIGLLGAANCLGQSVAAGLRPAVEYNFDGVAPLLRPLEGIARFQIVDHQIDRQNFRHGTGSERLTLRCPAGASAPLGFTLPPAPVISEFRGEVWLYCNRPGAQLAATVVLPRTIAPDTGQPRTLVVRGSNLGQGGQWEKLTLTDLPNVLARMARVARAQVEGPIDERGAYVAELVLLVPGGPGATEVLVDRIEAYGVISNPQNDARLSNDSQPIPLPATTASSAAQPVTLPAVPRIIRWQGEPFELLSRLGFQTVGMNRLPAREELAQLRQLGLSAVCPPPSLEEIGQHGIGPGFDCVLAWDLGEQLSAVDLNEMLARQQAIKRHDSHDSRPTVLAPHLFTREASRIADVLLVDRATLGTQLKLADYATWLTHRSRLARPGTPLWTRVDTQLGPQQMAQISGMGGAVGTDAVAGYAQLVGFTSSAVGVKARGFYFDSDSSLAAQDEPTLKRAQALELINVRLGLLEPWIASGKMLASARSNDIHLTALVLQAERSHLLVPIWWDDASGPGGARPGPGPFTFLVPGVAESSEAYLLTLGGPQRLRHQRVTGGMRITVEQLPTDGLVLLTDDPTAFSQVSRYLRRAAPRATQLRRNLAAMHWQASARAYASAPAGTVSQQELQAVLAEAKRVLSACDQHAAARNYETAYHDADRVEQMLDICDRRLWDAAVRGRSVAENPLAFSVQTLTELSRIDGQLTRSAAGENRLPQGGFEDLSQLLKSGWRHEQLTLEGISTAVRLSPQAPHGGAYCLQLEAVPADLESPAPVVASSPVWVSSPAVAVHAGDVVEIIGQARVNEELLGSVDGLQIFDSLGGEELAVRIRSSPSWQPFRLVRAVEADAEVIVTIALTGLGTAQVDDLAFRVLRPAAAPPLAVSP